MPSITQLNSQIAESHSPETTSRMRLFLYADGELTSQKTISGRSEHILYPAFSQQMDVLMKAGLEFPESIDVQGMKVGYLNSDMKTLEKIRLSMQELYHSIQDKPKNSKNFEERREIGESHAQYMENFLNKVRIETAESVRTSN